MAACGSPNIPSHSPAPHKSRIAVFIVLVCVNGMDMTLFNGRLLFVFSKLGRLAADPWIFNQLGVFGHLFVQEFRPVWLVILVFNNGGGHKYDQIPLSPTVLFMSKSPPQNRDVAQNRH